MSTDILKFIKRMFSNDTASPLDATVIPRPEHCISRADISDNALKVLKKLKRGGFEAYLVGGGVRDLLLRQAPKDFDVATDATPEQVKKLFRNCRLIGKRFPLAHIHFGREIIEVATFRALHSGTTKDSDSEMIWRDNHYGSLEEDACRRDFTVNGLYYNIADFSVVDFHGGMNDLKERRIKMIGDPVKRYAEDPVRILRAIRFAAKLDFHIEPTTAAPIKTSANQLNEVSSSRLFEECIKLFHGGHARKTFLMLSEYGLLQILFPEVAESCEENTALEFILKCLDSTDDRVRQQKPVTPAFMFSAFLWRVVIGKAELFIQEGMPRPVAYDRAMREAVATQNHRVAISKRFVTMMREIWNLQYRLEKRSSPRITSLVHHPRFRAAYDFLMLRSEVGEVEKDLADWWTTFQSVSDQEREAMAAPYIKKRKRRRRS